METTLAFSPELEIAPDKLIEEWNADQDCSEMATAKLYFRSKAK